LVLSTLHTNDAISTAVRLVDMGVDGFLVASAVHGIVAQRLLRINCDQCLSSTELEAGQKAWLTNALGEEKAEAMQFYRGTGCPACGDTGYSGRTAVYEMLEITSELAEALRQENYDSFKQIALSQPDFVPLLEGALNLAVEKRTSIDEVIRISGWQTNVAKADASVSV